MSSVAPLLARVMFLILASQLISYLNYLNTEIVRHSVQTASPLETQVPGKTLLFTIIEHIV